MRKLNPTLVALLAGVVVLLGLITYFATVRSSEQDRLTGNQVANEVSKAQPANAEKRCSSQATYDLIKRELFSQAVQQRGGDQSAYDRLASFAFLRMENPVMESADSATGAVNCSGSLSLDLPPGVAAAGGRRSLMADIDYTVDASGGVTLHNADALIGPLASLARGEQAPAPPPETNEAAPEQPEANVAASQSANVQPGPPSAFPGRPSFDCSKPRSRGAIEVCSDAGLSALDLNMMTQYRRAFAEATPAQQQLLQATASRFLAYRERCPNRKCIADAYIGRMREIRDIMEGR